MLPCRGTNIASLLEPIRRASVEVIGQCFTIAAEVNAARCSTPGIFCMGRRTEKSRTAAANVA